MPTTAKPTAAEIERAMEEGYNQACIEADALLTRLTNRCKAQIAILDLAVGRIVDRTMEESEDD